MTARPDGRLADCRYTQIFFADACGCLIILNPNKVVFMSKLASFLGCLHSGVVLYILRWLRLQQFEVMFATIRGIVATSQGYFRNPSRLCLCFSRGCAVV